MQGQEKDIVIFSFARTEGSGFLSMDNRLNVALTRAKRCLYICGNFMSLGVSFLKKVLFDDFLFTYFFCLHRIVAIGENSLVMLNKEMF